MGERGETDNGMARESEDTTDRSREKQSLSVKKQNKEEKERGICLFILLSSPSPPPFHLLVLCILTILPIEEKQDEKLDAREGEGEEEGELKKKYLKDKKEQ